MTNVSFSGSGTTAIVTDQIGSGQGLNVGDTELDFANGLVQLKDTFGQTTTIGKFRGFVTKNAQKNVVHTIVFKAKTKCTLYIEDTIFTYETIGEYVTFNHIDISSMKINRVSTGQSPDVFDWQIIASDNPEYKFSVQQSNRDSETEVLFPSAQKVVGTYTQKVNLRGAKKIILQGASPGSIETGVATVTMEVFDPASNTWNLIVPNQDLFTIAQGQNKLAEVADTGSKSPIMSQYGALSPPVANGNPPVVNQTLSGNVNSNGVSAVGSSVGHFLPSGDNILRVKVIIATNPLTFSISITKVFD